MQTVKYLRKIEWSMGNGQCPECLGLGPENFYENLELLPRHPEDIGHLHTCLLAISLIEQGQEVVLKGKYTVRIPSQEAKRKKFEAKF